MTAGRKYCLKRFSVGWVHPGGIAPILGRNGSHNYLATSAKPNNVALLDKRFRGMGEKASVPQPRFLLFVVSVNATLSIRRYSRRCHLHPNDRFKRWFPASCVVRWCHLHQSRRFRWFCRFSCFAHLPAAFHNQEGQDWRWRAGQRGQGYQGSSSAAWCPSSAPFPVEG